MIIILQSYEMKTMCSNIYVIQQGTQYLMIKELSSSFTLITTGHIETYHIATYSMWRTSENNLCIFACRGWK